MGRKLGGLVTIALVLCGCVKDPTDALVEQARSNITRQMIDPTTPLISVTVTTLAHGGYVCGAVNGKNRLGAYSGDRTFMYHAGRGQIADQGDEEEALFYCCTQVVEAANSTPPKRLNAIAHNGCRYAGVADMVHPDLAGQAQQ